MCLRDAEGKPLEERKRSLEESLYSNDPDALEMLQKMREVQQEEQFILSEIMKRYIWSLLCIDLSIWNKILRKSKQRQIENANLKSGLRRTLLTTLFISGEILLETSSEQYVF